MIIVSFTASFRYLLYLITFQEFPNWNLYKFTGQNWLSVCSYVKVLSAIPKSGHEILVHWSLNMGSRMRTIYPGELHKRFRIRFSECCWIKSIFEGQRLEHPKLYDLKNQDKYTSSNKSMYSSANKSLHSIHLFLHPSWSMLKVK